MKERTTQTHSTTYKIEAIDSNGVEG